MSLLQEADLQLIIDELIDRFWNDGLDPNGSNQSFRGRVLRRRALFHNQEPPQLFGRLANMPVFQSDLPRQKWSELRARITENHFTVRVLPVKDTATQRTDANEFEAVLNAGLQLVEERIGYQLQDAMSDGQILDGLSVLHWRKADEIYPEYPEAEKITELPDDEGERKRYASRRKNGYYEETPDSVKERRQHTCAKAGFPWHIEVLDCLQVLWIEDEFGLAQVVVLKEMGLLRYAKALDEEATSAHEANGALSIYRERALIPEQSNIQPADRVAVAQVWDRDCWYELICPSSTGGVQRGTPWTLVKSNTHNYGMPPFAIVPAVRLQNFNPRDGFLSALEGIFRLKPTVDRSISLMLALQEQGAVPIYYLKREGSGEPLLDESGDAIQLTADAAAAFKVPDGYTFAELRADVDPGFVQASGFIRQEMLDAAPKTGRSQFSATTSPWTMRLALEMENVEPRMLIMSQVRALQKMVRNITHVMSQEVEPTYVYARYVDGNMDKAKVLGIDPKAINSLDIQIDINASSQAERVSIIEHGKTLHQEGYLTMVQFLDEYMKVENPDRRYAELVSFKVFEQEVMPLLIKQEVARQLAQMVALGPNGQFIGPGGMQVTPEQVLQQQQRPQQRPPQMGQQQMPTPPMSPSGPMSPQMPALTPLQEPNTLQLPGRPG